MTSIKARKKVNH